MLKKRLITALCGLPLLIAIIWFGEPYFTILVAVWGLLAALEFYRLVARAKAQPLTYLGLLLTVLFIVSPHLSQHGIDARLLLGSAVVVSLIWLLLRPQQEAAFTGWAWTIAGILYLGWLLSYLVALRGLDLGRDWVFFALLTNSGSDSTAFFIGRAWGKHHLAPHISPGKTWEGAVAGLLGAIIVSVVLTYLLSLPLSYGQAILLGSLVSVFGQIGDLAESLFKRNMGVKESGRLVPGHGGLLDRTDSVLLAGIVVYYYVIWVV